MYGKRKLTPSQSNSDASVHQDVITDTETLVRELLKAGAAVIMLSTWGLGNGYINGADSHATVSEYYVSREARATLTPRTYPASRRAQCCISTSRNIRTRRRTCSRTTTWDTSTRADTVSWPTAVSGRYSPVLICLFQPLPAVLHFPPPARFARASLTPVLDYLFDQSCRPSYVPPYPGLRGSELKSAFDPLTLPPLRIRQGLDDTPYDNPAAYCASANAQNPDGSWQLVGEHVDGHANFTKMVWHDKHYWGADDVGARVTFPDVEVHGGFVGVYYLRSGVMGLGNLRCWVDGDEGGAKLLVGQWGYVSVGSVGAVATGLAPGKHSLTCEVDQTTNSHMGDQVEGGLHKVRIIAVIAS